MVQGLPMTECGADALAILPSSEAAGLVRRQDERVRFVHDMFADWARLKQLIEHDLPNSDATVRRAATAGWYRAVRLYAQRLLEQPGDGAGRWQRSVQALGSGGPEHAIVRDLFLEALVLSNDAAYLLTTVWQVLVAGDGELLALLIDRFRYVGTVADERALAGIENRAAAAQLEHLLRVPFEPYWYGVLPVLARHPDDLVRCALGPVAKLLRLWLSKVSPARRMTRPLRATAARLVLTIAREVQAREAESRMSVEDEVKTDCTSPCCGRPPNARTRSPSSASNWPTAGRSRNRCGSAARPPPRRTGGRWNAYPKPTRGPRGSSEPRPHWTRY